MYRAAIRRLGGAIALVALGFFNITPAAAEHGDVPAPRITLTEITRAATSASLKLQWDTEVANYTSIVEIKLARLPWSSNSATRAVDILPISVRRTDSAFYDTSPPPRVQEANFVGLTLNENYEIRSRILHEGVLSDWSPTLPVITSVRADTPVLRALFVPDEYKDNIITPLSPTFSPFVTQYYLEVGVGLNAISLVPVPEGDATVRLKLIPEKSGDFSRHIRYGINRMQFIVTAADGRAVKTYDVEITQQRYETLDLGVLDVRTLGGDRLTLRPYFRSGHYSYSVAVPGINNQVRIVASPKLQTGAQYVVMRAFSSSIASVRSQSTLSVVLNVTKAVTEVDFVSSSKADSDKYSQIYTIAFERTPREKLPAPELLPLIAKKGELKLLWSPPLPLGLGSTSLDIQGYRIRWSNDGNNATWENPGAAAGMLWSGGTPAPTGGGLTSQTPLQQLTEILENLPNGKEHRVEVAAYNNEGVGDWSQAQSATPANDDKRLLQLLLSEGTLSPAFAVDRYAYNVAVGYNVAQLLFRPLANDIHARVTVGGVYVPAGEGITQSFPANATTTIKIVVAAQNGSKSRPYVVQITRDEGLPGVVQGLEVLAGADTLAAQWSEPDDINAPPVTSYKVRWKLASPNSPYSNAVVTPPPLIHVLPNLTEGETYDVEVAAVNRIGQGAWVAVEGTAPIPLSDDATLAGLAISAGALVPAFSPATTIYRVDVPNVVDELTFTPTFSHEAATALFQASGSTDPESILSGEESRALSLAVDTDTHLGIFVRAEDGNAIKIYTITITRAAGAPTAVRTPVALPLPAGLEVSWLIPEDDNGERIVGYKIRWKLQGGADGEYIDLPATPTRYTIPNLAGKRAYDVEVAAFNRIGESPAALVRATTGAATDASLRALTIAPGALAEDFVASELAYTASVEHATDSIAVTATLAQADATLSINGKAATSGSASAPISLVVGANLIEIAVEAQDTSIAQTYTLTITRAPGPPPPPLILTAVASEDALAVAWDEPAEDHGSEIIGYKIRWRVKGTEERGDPVDAQGATSHTIDGLESNTTYRVRVAARNRLGIGEYVRADFTTLPSSNADLAGLASSLGALAFSAAQTEYAIALANPPTEITLTPTASHAGAAISIGGAAVASGTLSPPQPLVAGATTAIAVVVTAQDGTTEKIYTVNVRRDAGAPSEISDLNVVARLDSLAIDWRAPDDANGSPILHYLLRWKLATASAYSADIVVSGTSHTLADLANGAAYDLEVAAANVIGTSAYVAARATTSQSSDADLAGLAISAGALVPAFAPTHTKYAVAVANEITNLTFTPEAAHAGASITIGGQAVANGATSAPLSLAVGQTKISLVVTAQDGTAQTYTFNVTRALGAPRDLTLDAGVASLSLRWRAPADAASVTSYRYRWSNDGDATTWESAGGAAGVLIAHAAATNHIISGLTNGTEYVVQVAAMASGDIGAWSDSQSGTPLNNDASLRALVLSAGTLSPVFAPATYDYTATVAHEVAALTVTATATDTAAQILGPLVVDLAVGETLIPVGVLAPNGEAGAVYTVVVTRAAAPPLPPQETATPAPTPPPFVPPPATTPPLEDPADPADPNEPPAVTPAEPPDHVAPSDDASLAGLEIAEIAFAFVPATSSYTMAVSNDVASLTLTPTTSHAGASVALGDTSLTAGATTAITITVTAEDGRTQKTYTLNVARAPDAPRGLTLSAGVEALLLEWVAPEGNVTGYRYRWSDNGDDGTWEGEGDANSTSHTISGLVNNTEYFLQVAAVADDQTGAWSDSQSGTPRSADASLRALVLSAGSLSPEFAPTTFSYAATVAHEVAEITITPTANDEAAEILASPTTELAAGETTQIAIGVLAPNGEAGAVYTVMVVREGPPIIGGDEVLVPPVEPPLPPEEVATPETTPPVILPPSDEPADPADPVDPNEPPTVSPAEPPDHIVPSADASLKTLELSVGSLSPDFAPTTYNYTATVAYEVEEIAITSTATDKGAEVFASRTTELAAGETTQIAIGVLAPDGEAVAIYTVMVTREGAPIIGGDEVFVPPVEPPLPPEEVATPEPTPPPVVLPPGTTPPAPDPNNPNDAANPDNPPVVTAAPLLDRIAPSDDATLAGLKLSAGGEALALVPPFASATTAGYVAKLPPGMTAVGIMPIVSQKGATVARVGDANDGNLPAVPSLGEGYMMIGGLTDEAVMVELQVTAENGATQTYSLMVMPQPQQSSAEEQAQEQRAKAAEAHANRNQAAEAILRQANAAHLSSALDVVTHHALTAGTIADAGIVSRTPAGAATPRALALMSEEPLWRDSDWGEVLGDSAFRLGLTPAGANGAWSLNVWGAGDVRGFDTDEATGMGYAGYFGMDYGTPVFRAGVAVGYNTTQSTAKNGAAESESESWFANVYPYLRVTPTKRLDLWMLLGAGGGQLTMDDDRTDSLHHFYALGAELDLTSLGRVHFGAKTDASVALFESTETDKLNELSLRHYRYRFALDTKLDLGDFRPNLEVGMRLDAGDDALTIGAEVAAGMQYRIGRVSAQARGRVLAYDTAGAALQEWGAGLTLRLLPSANGEGLSASVAPSWGHTGARTGDIWVDDIGGDIGNDNLALPTPALALQTELAWTFRHKQALITPLAQYAIAGAQQTLGLGTRLALAPLALELLGEHITTQNEYRLSLTTRMRF